MQFIKPNQFKANLHSHSTFSDGRLTAEEMKAAYKAHGYSILAVTDHEHPLDHTDLSENDFLMLTGYEAYIRPSKECISDPFAKEIHLNLFPRDPHKVDVINWNDRYVKYVTDPEERAKMHRFGDERPREFTVEYINSFIENARKDGYLVTLNHPVWSMAAYDFLFDIHGYFSVEMCNYGTYRMGLPEYNGAFYDMLLRQGRRVFTHAADDNHNKEPLDTPASDSFGAFTMINTEGDVLDHASVIAALEKGTFYASMGPTIHTLEIAGGKAHITCSDALRITMLYGAKSTKRVAAASFDGSVNEAEFDIPEQAPYVRFSVQDHFGRMADTRGYFRDEF